MEKVSTQNELSKAEGKEELKDGSSEASAEGGCVEGVKADASDTKSGEHVAGAGEKDKTDAVGCEAES